VQGRTANDRRLAAGNVLHRQHIGITGIRHIIDHQHPPAGHRDAQRFHQPRPALAPGAGRVVHDAHAGQRHDAERVREQTGRHIAAARDGHNQVRLESGCTDGMCQCMCQTFHPVPRHHIATEFALHRCA